jgi:NADPH-dependent ferric siderophore reductase
MPSWNGKSFLPDGRRPTIRTFTPRRLDPDALELDLDIVIHAGGVAPRWRRQPNPATLRRSPARAGAPPSTVMRPPTCWPVTRRRSPRSASCSRPCRRDSSEAHIEVARPEARLRLPDHPRATVDWCDPPPGASPGEALLAAVRGANLASARVWAAGEAAAMQRIRRHLFEDRGLPRAQAAGRGYRKHGRSGDADTDA